VTAPSHTTRAGRAYLDLRAKARGDRRPVDELLQLYVLESFLARLASSRFADQLVLKGGVLLAAFGERRPTRDVDLQAEALDNDADNVRTVICEVANLRLDDGVTFDVDGATAAVIRDEDAYSGVRVTMQAELATARPHFHVDVNVGDPVTPAFQELRRVLVPRQCHLADRVGEIRSDQWMTAAQKIDIGEVPPAGVDRVACQSRPPSTAMKPRLPVWSWPNSMNVTRRSLEVEQ
jgi:hypothetical protein